MPSQPPNHNMSSPAPHPSRPSLLSLPDELLAEIGTYFMYDRDLPTATFRSHYTTFHRFEPQMFTANEHHPPACFGWRHSRDLRAFRKTCSRIRNAVGLEGLHVTIREMADMAYWIASPNVEAVSRIRFELRWEPVHQWDYEDMPRHVRKRLDMNDNIDIPHRIERLGQCLAAMANLTQISVANLPYGWCNPKHAHRNLTPQFQNATLPPDIRLAKLRALEIADDRQPDCVHCCAAFTALFWRWIPQCSVVKLGAALEANTEAVYPDGHTNLRHILHVETSDDQLYKEFLDFHHSGLLDALSMPYFPGNTKLLFLQDDFNFVRVRLQLRWTRDRSFIIDDACHQDDLLDNISAWQNLEELDMRLRAVSDDHSEERQFVHDPPAGTNLQRLIRPQLVRYIVEVMESWELAATQSAVIMAIASRIPTLRKIWFWDRLNTGLRVSDRCLHPRQERWRLMCLFRMSWHIERRGGKIILKRDRIVETFNGSGTVQLFCSKTQRFVN